MYTVLNCELTLSPNDDLNIFLTLNFTFGQNEIDICFFCFSRISCHFTNSDLFASSFTSPRDITRDISSFFRCFSCCFLFLICLHARSHWYLHVWVSLMCIKELQTLPTWQYLSSIYWSLLLVTCSFALPPILMSAEPMHSGYLKVQVPSLSWLLSVCCIYVYIVVLSW